MAKDPILDKDLIIAKDLIMAKDTILAKDRILAKDHIQNPALQRHLDGWISGFASQGFSLKSLTLHPLRAARDCLQFAISPCGPFPWTSMHTLSEARCEQGMQ